MYSPTQFRVDDPALIAEVLLHYPFAVLLSDTGISHLPFLYLPNDAKLLSHMAAANTQKLLSGQKVKVLFHGPHVYISPALYPPKADNVPTWNYVAVHVEGQLRIVETHADKVVVMKQLIEHFEHQYQTGWEYENNSAQQAMYTGITVFEVTDLVLQAKFKLSQHQKSETREGVIRDLPTTGHPQKDAAEISDWMRRLAPRK